MPPLLLYTTPHPLEKCYQVVGGPPEMGFPSKISNAGSIHTNKPGDYAGCKLFSRSIQLRLPKCRASLTNLALFAWRCSLSTSQKNPRAHKNKIGTSPPNPKYPPPKTRNFMDMVFSCRTDAFFQASHKIGAAISGPRIADTNFTDTRIF